MKCNDYFVFITIFNAACHQLSQIIKDDHQLNVSNTRKNGIKRHTEYAEKTNNVQ